MIRRLNHLSRFLSMQRCSGSTPSSLLSLSLRLNPATLWGNLIPATCTRNNVFSAALPRARDHRWRQERRQSGKSRASPRTSALSSRTLEEIFQRKRTVALLLSENDGRLCLFVIMGVVTSSAHSSTFPQLIFFSPVLF